MNQILIGAVITIGGVFLGLTLLIILNKAWRDATHRWRRSRRRILEPAILRYVRGGTASVATFLESDVEVDELQIEAGSAADGARVLDLHLPHSIVLGAVIRPEQEGEIVRGHTVLHAGDNVVVFARPDAIPALRKVFAA